MARIIIIIIIIVSWIYRKDQEEYIFEEEEGLKNSIPFEFLFYTREEQFDCNTSHIYTTFYTTFVVKVVGSIPFNSNYYFV